MGYYVNTTFSNAVLPKDHEAAAYEIMCSLNVTHHDQKRGGSYTAGGKTQSWFSWMDANYPETCKDAGDIFEMLGFEIERNDDGIHLINYDNKSGQEDLFLSSIENLMVGKIVWVGEDGDSWTNEFMGDNVINGEVDRTLLTHQQ